MIQKQNILDQSAELFKNYGIRSISMDDISQKMGISKKTLYQIVPEKERLIEELLIQEYNALKARFQQITKQSSDIIDELMQLNFEILRFLREIKPVAIFDMKKYYPELYRNWSQKFSSLIGAIIIENVKKGKEAGLYRKSIDVKLIAHLHTERIDQLQESNKLWEELSETPTALKEMITFYLRGLITAEGEKYFNQHIEKFENYFN